MLIGSLHRSILSWICHVNVDVLKIFIHLVFLWLTCFYAETLSSNALACMTFDLSSSKLHVGPFFKRKFG